MKPIRHLITIVFLLCGLTALGSERGYDRNDLDRYVVKELEILDKNNLFWGYHLQEGYEKRVELCRYYPNENLTYRRNDPLSGRSGFHSQTQDCHSVLRFTILPAEDDHSGGGCCEQEDEGDRTCAGYVFSHLV